MKTNSTYVPVSTMVYGGDFDDSVKDGHAVELWAQNHYGPEATRKGYKIVDVSNEPKRGYQDKIDHVYLKYDGTEHTVDVKCDRRSDGKSFYGKPPTGNIIYERKTHTKSGEERDGCSEKTEAEYVLFVLGIPDYVENSLTITKCVWIPVKRWREYTYDPKHPERRIEHWKKETNPVSENDRICDYHHKLEDLIKEGVVVKVNTKMAGEKIYFPKKKDK